MRTDIQPFDIKSDMEGIIACITDRLSRQESPLVIAVCGGTSTGKTTVVTQLIRSAFSGRTSLISQDHFQLLKVGRDELDPRYGLDHVDHYGIDDCMALVDQLRQGDGCRMPRFDFKTRRHVGSQYVASRSVVIVEGLYSAYGDLRKSADMVIYIESCAYERLIRRIFRNRFERYVGLPQDGNRSVFNYLTRVIRAHQDFVKSQRPDADFILNNPIRFGFLLDKYGIPTPISPAPNERQNVWMQEFLNTQCAFHVDREGTQHYFSIRWGDVPFFETPVEADTLELILTQDWLEM